MASYTYTQSIKDYENNVKLNTNNDKYYSL